jgi:hypothetical protein
MSRRLKRSYAIANLVDIQPTPAVNATEQLWTQVRNANDTESEVDSALGTPKGSKHGQPATDSRLAKIAAPLLGIEAGHSSANEAMPMAHTPAVINGKEVPPRSPRPLRSNRVINPGAPDMVKPRERKRTLNVNDVESEATSTLKGRKRGRMDADSMLAKTAEPLLAIDSAAASIAQNPTDVHRKVMPPRAKRVTNPGAPDMVKPRRTSAEVTAAAARKAALQLQADILEQQRIEMLAQMELEEEEEDEDEEERTVVRKQTPPDSRGSDIEDAIMQWGDEDNSTSDAAKISEFSATEEDDGVKAKKVVPNVQKPNEVRPF